MSRKIFIFSLLCLMIVGQVWARPIDRQKDSAYHKAIMVKGPAVAIRPGDVVDAVPDLGRPMRDDFDEVAYGEDEVIGYTWYDYQHNGSIGKMIARDSDGGTHFVWMEGYGRELGSERHVVYNFIDEEGNMAYAPDERAVVDGGDRSGYCMLSIIPEGNLAAPFYHVLGHVEDANVLGNSMSVDWVRGLGAFTASYPPPMPNNPDLAWPHGDIDRQGVAHLTATENTDPAQLWQRVAYWRGEQARNGDWEWGERPTFIDTASVISAVVAASSQSDKVAIGWHHNRVGTDIGDWANSPGGYQRNNDIVYIISEDGEEFAWRDGIQSLTKIVPPDPDLVDVSMAEAYGDTFRPYCDLDIQFDPWEGEDNLYGVFAASGFQERPIVGDGGEVVDAVYGAHGHLWFWNSIEDTLTMIADGWYDQITTNGAANGNFRQGAWRLNVDRGSIAFNPEDPGTVYVVWTHFPHIFNYVVDEDGNAENVPVDGAQIQDTSATGYINAETMVSISNDRGITWRQPINVTETIWDGDEAPEPGECQSENWASVAKVADGALHITYIMDTDAGGIPQTEGVPTQSPVKYHRIDLEDLPENDFVEVAEGFMFHNYYDPAPSIRDILRDPASPTPGGDVLISAEVSPPDNVDIEIVFVEYKVGGAEGEVQSVQMDTEGDEMFFGTIPGMDDASGVWYRINAIDTDGGETVTPTGYWHSYVVRPEGELQVRDIQFRPLAWAADTDRSPYNGYEVTFDGVITTDADFATFYGGYAIQDAQEEWSGVIIRGIDDALEVGQAITVTGTVMERDIDDSDKWNYMTYIDVSSYESTGMVEPWAPIQIEVSDMRFSTNAEALEGCLVELGRIRVSPLDDAPDFYIPINDMNRNDLSEGWITTYGLEEGVAEDLFEDIVNRTIIDGITGVFVENERYALAPRTDRDVGAMVVRDDNAPTPLTFSLDAAYPNPFNSKTTIGFKLASTSNVSMNVYDLEGRLVQNLISGSVQAGQYKVSIDAASYAAGMYLLRLEADDFTANQKLLLIK